MSRMLAERIRSEDSGPSDEEVRQELSTLLGRAEFHASERNRRFLSYIVEETLQGRADRIKAYSIAIATFDRSDDFDPLTDPIVRIEASRLRRSLEHYYLTAGKVRPHPHRHAQGLLCRNLPLCGSDAGRGTPFTALCPRRRRCRPSRRTCRSSLPNAARSGRRVAAAILGSGRPRQRWSLSSRSRPPPMPGSATRKAAVAVARGPSVIVLPFENVGAGSSQDFIARGLTFEVINSLTRFSDLFVFGPETSFGIGDPDLRATSLRALQPDYVLYGSVYSTDDALRVSAILADARSNRSVWSTNFDRDLSTANLLSIQSDIAEQVASAIGQPYGAVFNLTAEDIAKRPLASLRSYECVVRFRQRWREYDQRDYGDMRACLEQTIKADPGYARAYASLALLDIDTVRFGFGEDQIEAIRCRRPSSLPAARSSSIPSGPTVTWPFPWPTGSARTIEASIATAKRGLAIDPHNTDLLAELGLRYAFMEQWSLSQPLIARGVRSEPRHAQRLSDRELPVPLHAGRL